jgi:hypothetical protein
MTPLAYSIWKQKWSPIKDRTIDDKHALLSMFDDIHCFEVSAISELTHHLSKDYYERSRTAGPAHDGKMVNAAEQSLAFLPAPKTWIEYAATDGNGVHYREGCLLIKTAANEAFCTFARATKYSLWTHHQMLLCLRGGERFKLIYLRDDPDQPDGNLPIGEQILHSCRLYAQLALINSPRVIGRRQHTRKLPSMPGFAGSKFPLLAWTEIKLEVSKPILIDDGQPHEATLTGRRALHFCREHIRIKNGKLEYVTSHWRGDASIGIKRSRYVVTP